MTLPPENVGPVLIHFLMFRNLEFVVPKDCWKSTLTTAKICTILNLRVARRQLLQGGRGGVDKAPLVEKKKVV